MKAKLIYKAKEIDPDGFITEMVIWALPVKNAERPHGLKYRLYYGDALGNCIVRYDNEAGKGDHKHIGDREEPYQFETVEKLVADFMVDIDRLTHTGANHERQKH
jgi:hypothetical protein